MTGIKLITEGDGCWPDLMAMRAAGATIYHLGNNAPPLQFALLRGGTSGGHASVTIRIDLPNGDVVLAETTLALLGTAADTLRAVPGATVPQ